MQRGNAGVLAALETLREAAIEPALGLARYGLPPKASRLQQALHHLAKHNAVEPQEWLTVVLAVVLYRIEANPKGWSMDTVAFNAGKVLLKLSRKPIANGANRSAPFQRDLGRHVLRLVQRLCVNLSVTLRSEAQRRERLDHAMTSSLLALPQ